jgi:parallel beta-helix repeat protein
MFTIKSIYKKSLSLITIILCLILILTSSIGLFVKFNDTEFTGTAEAVMGTRATAIAAQHIIVNTTWTAAGSPYMIKGDVYIDSGVFLNLEPGCVVKFEGLYSIFVNGTLNSTGTSLNPVTVTSKTQSEPGEWNSLYVNSSGNIILKYTKVSYGTTNILLDGSSDNIFENVEVFGSKKWGLMLDHSNGNTILNSTFHTNIWSGLFIDTASNNRIFNCSFHNNSYDGFTEDYSVNNFVENCTFNNNLLAGIHLFKSESIKLKNVTTNTNANGIILGSSKAGTILDFKSNYNNDMSIYVHYSKNFIINKGECRKNKIGLGLLNSYGNRFENLGIIYNKKMGADIEDSSDNQLIKCIIAEDGSTGLFLRKGQLKIGSHNNRIISSDIYNNTNGIYSLYSSEVEFSDLTVYNNTNGLFLFESHNSSITNCNISGNSNAVRVWRSSDVEVSNSLVKDNIIGIFMGTGSNRNTVHHNNILNNSLNGGDSNPGNFWDDKISEGNYWSDYNGTDYDQNGIGDQPHPVTNFSRDRWPLVDKHNIVLKVISTDPVDDEILVPMDTKVNISFSESIERASIVDRIMIEPYVEILNLTWSNNDRNISLELPYLRNGTTYNFTIDAGITSYRAKVLQYPYHFRFTTVDPFNGSRPFVRGHSPKGNSVIITTNVTITFNGPVWRPSLDSAISIKPDIPYELVLENESRVILDPMENLSFDVNYTVNITTDVMNLIGNTMYFPYTFSFTTESDHYPPYVIDSFPTGDEPFPVNTEMVIIVFNEAVNTTSVEKRFGISPHSNGSIHWQDNNRTFVYQFKGNLSYNTSYTVSLDAGLTDLVGNPTTEIYSFKFSTVEQITSEFDTQPPIIIDFFPDSSAPISIDTKMVIIMFNEPVNKTTVEERFSITPKIRGELKWKTLDQALYYNFNHSLLHDTTYSVKILPGYEDLNGNPNLELFEFSFKTVPGISPFQVIEHFPTGIDIPVNEEIRISFNKEPDKPSVESAFSISPNVDGNFKWFDTALIFVPAENLSFNQTYNITVTTLAMDTMGIFLAGPFIWNFTTVVSQTTEPDGPDDNDTKPDGIDDDQEPSEESDGGNNLNLIGASAAVAVIILLILLFLFFKRKKKPEGDEKHSDEIEESTIPKPVPTPILKESTVKKPMEKMHQASPRKVPKKDIRIQTTKPVTRSDIPRITGRSVKMQKIDERK